MEHIESRYLHIEELFSPGIGRPDRLIFQLKDQKVNLNEMTEKGAQVKRFVFGAGVFLILLWTSAAAQGLKIGVGGGGVFLQGSRNLASSMFGREGGFSTTYSFGGEVEYEIPTAPINVLAQVSFAPLGGNHRRGDGFGTLGTGGRRRSDGGLLSAGVGARWVPVTGLASPYLGLSLILSHVGGSRNRFDSLGWFSSIEGPGMPGDGVFGRQGDITRFGVGFGVGSEFELSTLFDLDVGASYTLNSLFAERRGGSLNSISFGASVLFRVL